MFVCDFDEYHIQLYVANTCNIMLYAFMLMIHDNGITKVILLKNFQTVLLVPKKIFVNLPGFFEL